MKIVNIYNKANILSYNGTISYTFDKNLSLQDQVQLFNNVFSLFEKPLSLYK